MTYDLIVAGLGTAGCMAALAAGRRGRSVLALEKTSYPGGLQTGGLITEYCYQNATGLAAELEAECRCLMADGAYASCIEAKKRILDQNLLAAGVEIHYEVTILSVLMTDNVIKGIVWLENGVQYQAEAAIVIDATAEAVVCRLAGCELQGGRAVDGRYQHSSVIHEFRKGRETYGYSGLPLRVNQEDVGTFSRASLQADAALLQQNCDGFRLTAPSDRPGLREGRHIVPPTVPTMEDFTFGRAERLEPIAYAWSQFDTNITDPMLESENFQDWMIAATQWGTKLWLPIPRTALFPRNRKRLIAAGRHLGIDHDCGHALRMNAAMSLVGEAAGIIADAAVARQMPPDELPYDVIRPLLSLPESPDVDNAPIWDLNEEEILAGLATDSPGNAIWSVCRQANTALLQRCLNTADAGSPLHCHAVFALALLRDERAIPFLREMVERRDPTRQRSVSYDQGMGAPAITVSHGGIAIYLLGRFRDPGAVPLLKDVLNASASAELRSEFHAYAIAALLKIGEDRPEWRERIAAILRRAVDNPAWTLPLRVIKYAPETFDAAPEFRRRIDEQQQKWQLQTNLPIGESGNDAR